MLVICVLKVGLESVCEGRRSMEQKSNRVFVFFASFRAQDESVMPPCFQTRIAALFIQYITEESLPTYKEFPWKQFVFIHRT